MTQTPPPFSTRRKKKTLMGSDNREVIDEVSNWLRIYSDGTVDRTWTGPPEPLFLMEPVPPHDTPINNVTVHDIPSNSPTFRVYFPEAKPEPKTRLPILIHFHGGGFCISHATWYMYHQFYSRLASSIPALILSPFLPLAPEHRLPAAIDVCHDFVMRILSTNGFEDPFMQRFKNVADMDRVFLIGDSSGGNLVHQVAGKVGPVLAGAIMLHPGFARARRSGSEMDESRESPMLTLEMVDKFLGYALPVGATKDHPITCPMNADLEELQLPPLLVAVADRDLIQDTNSEYCEAMRKAGKDVEVVVSEGVGHSFYLNKLEVDMDPVAGRGAQELALAIKDFVLRH